MQILWQWRSLKLLCVVSCYDNQMAETEHLWTLNGRVVCGKGHVGTFRIRGTSSCSKSEDK